MRKLTLALSAAACVGLAAPAFAAERVSAGQGSKQVVSAQTGKIVAQYTGTKKSKKKPMAKRSSWGG